MRYVNLIAGLLVLGLFLAGGHFSKLSTDVWDLLPADPAIDRLKIASGFNANRQILIAVQGFDDNALETLQTLQSALMRESWVEQTLFDLENASTPLHPKNTAKLMGTFQPVELKAETVAEALSALKERLVSGALYTGIDPSDPLNLFKTRNPGAIDQHNGFLALPGYGYLLIATPKTEGGSDEAIYHAVKTLTEKSGVEIKAFAPFFYAVENAGFIKNDVQTILNIALALLLIVYVAMIRKPMLLLNAIVTLALSAMVALGVLLAVYDRVSLLAIVFGAAISAVAIDYLLHHYFHGGYAPDKRRFNGEVFFGFLTTATGFALLSNVAFLLIAQLSLFALISLSISYLLFAFLYPKLGLGSPALEGGANTPRIDRLARWPLAFGTVLLALGLSNTTFDTRLQNLDYNNVSLKTIEASFARPNLKKTPVLLEGDSVQALLRQSEILQQEGLLAFSMADYRISPQRHSERVAQLSGYDFDALRQLLQTEGAKLGFKAGTFDEAYRFVKTDLDTLIQTLETLPLPHNIEVVKQGDRFYTLALSDHDGSEWPGAFGMPVLAGVTIGKVFSKMLNSLMLWGTLAVAAVSVLLYVKTKGNFLAALGFVVLPVSAALLIVTLIGEVNLMHLFAFFILIITGIDYGIYMTSDSGPQTQRAILYALLSTFAGFGVLILSDTGAVQSIGTVITVGMATLLLLVFSTRLGERRV